MKGEQISPFPEELGSHFGQKSWQPEKNSGEREIMETILSFVWALWAWMSDYQAFVMFLAVFYVGSSGVLFYSLVSEKYKPKGTTSAFCLVYLLPYLVVGVPYFAIKEWSKGRRFIKTFGVSPDWDRTEVREAKQNLVNQRLGELARRLDEAYNNEVAAINTRDPKYVKECSAEVKVAKRSFWDNAHNLAAEFGYTVGKSYKEYLTA